MSIKKIFLALSLSVASTGVALPSPSGMDYSFDQSYPDNLVVNNRILLKINGKPVTVMDVVRKMDMLFYRQYPELASSVQARYQFYTTGWRSLLGAVIDDHLIMADAEEKGIQVNDGEVREELEKLFGPDVVLNLDKMGLTLDEAFELLKTELTVQRMTAVMVRSKAMTDVHPKKVRERYEEFIAANPPQDFWVYQILSIRGEEHEKVAQEAHRLISEQNIPFEEVVATLGEKNVEMAYSDEFRQKDRDLSLAYRAVLETLSIGTASTSEVALNVSPPISKKSVSRLFCLKEIEKAGLSAFQEKEDEVKGQLIQEAMVKYNEEYRQKLRIHYGLTEHYLNKVIPEDLQPFALK